MYVKVFSQIYDGTLCTKGPWEALVTFQQFLVLADPDGNVDMTAEAISRRTTIPLQIIELGIQILMKPDKKSRTPAEDGKRIIPLSEGRDWGWKIVNFLHYRNLKSEGDRREYHRNYWHKRKEKLNKLNSTQQSTVESTHSTQTQSTQYRQYTRDKRQETVNPIVDLTVDCPVDKSKNLKVNGVSRFNEFWDSYPKNPRKVGKGACEKIWSSKKLDSKVLEILADLEAKKKTRQFIDFTPAPRTYLNQERWRDEIMPDNAPQDDWWASNAGIDRKAIELGMTARGNESYADFKQRIFERLKK